MNALRFVVFAMSVWASTVPRLLADDKAKAFIASSGNDSAVAIIDKLQAAQLPSEALSYIAGIVDDHSSESLRRIASVVIGRLNSDAAHEIHLARFLRAKDNKLRAAAAFRVIALWERMLTSTKEQVRALAKNDALIRAGLCLRETDVDAISSNCLDVSAIVRASAARRIANRIQAKEVAPEKMTSAVGRLLCDHDQLVRSNALVAAREIPSVENLFVILEGLSLDLREHVSLEEPFLVDAEAAHVKRFVPHLYLDDSWTRSLFAGCIATHCPIGTPPRGFEQHFAIGERPEIGWHAVTILKVRDRDHGEVFLNELRRAHDVEALRRQILTR